VTHTLPGSPELARAFRETTLGLIGVFQVYEVDPDLTEATSEVLGALFRRHLGRVHMAAKTSQPNPMHALADELEDRLRRMNT